ncbi:hypothetical protein [Ammoniphilus sp. YIM 78166]|uniref:hypothetical protein n=1 Tax=Ammoniphilus sp. YIM 78166 TaxID=1644106 RepID=UPI00106FA54B|nr:hypothetical protein [Ammoniphilus sp. YIM 78166]
MGLGRFILEIQRIKDIPQLVELKEQIKEQVMDKHLDWQHRMLLYGKVQQINLRIDQLEYEKILS